MKKSDWICLFCVGAFLYPFFCVPLVKQWYFQWGEEHAFIMGFLKFAILATFGEILALRIRKGVYNEAGFGILPRTLVWGFLGIWIVLEMKVFSAGAPRIVDYLFSTDGAIVQAMKGSFSVAKLLGAFSISLLMNTTFAPVFMTLHKITDTHILAGGGSLRAFFRPMDVGNIMSSINWKVQWNFVFKKTIVFFWIPAHTITFLLPAQYQVLFAAILGVILGLILATAANKS